MCNIPAMVNYLYLSPVCILSGPITLILIFLVVPSWLCVCVCVRDMHSHVHFCPHNAEFLRYRPQLRPWSTIAGRLPVQHVPFCTVLYRTAVLVATQKLSQWKFDISTKSAVVHILIGIAISVALLGRSHACCEQHAASDTAVLAVSP